MRKYDLKGQRFGRLTVRCKSLKPDGHHNVYWICQCDCGRATIATTTALRQGYKRSCGCLRQDNGRVQAEKMLQHHQSHKING